MSPRVARFFNRFTRLPRISRAAAHFHGAVHRLTRGRLTKRWFGARLMVLETTGRRSGKTRKTPIIYIPDGERMLVSPANAGAESMPAWWLNLRAAGYGFAVIGDKRMRVLARAAEGEEREHLWKHFADRFRSLDIYRTFTDREFPIVILEPAEPKDYPPGD
jgi:F420H(2)-dependent quinone reductase